MIHLSPTALLKGTVALVLLLSSCIVAAAQKQDSKQITGLFSEIKEHASLAQGDAEILGSYLGSNISWQAHADRLRLVKAHVDDLLNDYNEMTRLRDEGSPWQQEAIDQLRPVLKSMADHLTATIQHQNEYPTHVKLEPWKEYVHNNTEYVTKASSLIHDIVDYGAAKSAAESLDKRLNLQAEAK